MVQSLIASIALFGALASGTSVGRAHVVNNCGYDVYLCSVPASGGGYEEEDKTLAAGETWDQTWTELSNGNGWSIKLSKSEALENILQYEYTFHNDGIVWYDLSCVNGNPWDQDWEITANGTDCNPKQQAYRYATDDAYGMQDCPQSSVVTVTLCTGLSADNGSSTDGSSPAPSYESSSSSVVEVASSSPSAPTYESSSPSAPTSESSSTASPDSYTTSAVEAPASYGYNWNNADASESMAAGGYDTPVTTPTTLATQTTAVVTEGPAGVIITEVETAYVTNVVTAYANRFRRHEHHPHGHHDRA